MLREIGNRGSATSEPVDPVDPLKRIHGGSTESEAGAPSGFHFRAAPSGGSGASLLQDRIHQVVRLEDAEPVGVRGERLERNRVLVA